MAKRLCELLEPAFIDNQLRTAGQQVEVNLVDDQVPSHMKPVGWTPKPLAGAEEATTLSSTGSDTALTPAVKGMMTRARKKVLSEGGTEEEAEAAAEEARAKALDKSTGAGLVEKVDSVADIDLQ